MTCNLNNQETSSIFYELFFFQYLNELLIVFLKFRKDILGDKSLFSILMEAIVQRIAGLQDKELTFLSLTIGDCHFSKQMGLKSRNHFIRGCLFL